ncbi:MAG: hypothetical protein ACYC99_14770, partial [Candidatus Geothermincolia bacterium]
MIFALLAFSATGCQSSATTTQKTNLETFINRLNLQFDTPMLQALAKGTILQVQNGKNSLLAKTKLSSFEVVSGTAQNAQVPPGTEVVIEVISPKGDYAPGKKIEAFVRVVKSTTGVK